jgi:translation initiation factor IF-3
MRPKTKEVQFGLNIARADLSRKIQQVDSFLLKGLPVMIVVSRSGSRTSDGAVALCGVITAALVNSSSTGRLNVQDRKVMVLVR